MIEELLDRIEGLRGGIDGLHATASSPDGLVTATVSGRGRLVGLDIDPRVYRSPDSRALAESVLAAAERAAGDAHRRLFDLLRPLLPADAEFARTDVDLDPFLNQLGRSPRR